MSESNNSAELLKRTLSLRLKHAAWNRDIRATRGSEGWEYFYAVDTDVIAMYIDPEARRSYGDVFGVDHRSAALVTRLLGDALFGPSARLLLPSRSLNRSTFLLIPPHDEELYRMLLAASRKLAQAASLDKAQFDRLSKVIEDYARTNDEGALFKGLQDNVPELVMLFDANSGLRARLDRFGALPDDLFIHISRYVDGTFSFPSFDIDRDEQFRSNVGRWSKRLREFRRRNQPLYALIGDATVLATIEQINALLEKERKRLFLITGSSYIFQAAGGYFPLPSVRGLNTFADLYLRHPQWIMSHPDFFRGDPKNEEQPVRNRKSGFTLEGWLGILFPEIPLRSDIREKPDAGEDEVRAEPMLAGSRRVNLLGGKALSQFPGEWEEQVRLVAIERYGAALEAPSAENAKHLAQQLHELVRKGHWSIDNLRRLVMKEAAQSLSRMYSHAVWLGLWSNSPLLGIPGKRMPALRFDEPYNSAIEGYYHKVLALQSRRNALTTAEQNDLLEMNVRLREADPSHYHSHIIHALAFATKGRYEAALTLCRIAMSITDNLPNSPTERRKGREAAFLAAVSCRRSAVQIEDLNFAMSFIADAERRENEDSASLDPRFKSEKLAIEMRRLYFLHFLAGSDSLSEAARLVVQLRDVIGDAKGELNKEVREWVLRQCYTNLFDLTLVLSNSGSWRLESDLGQRLKCFCETVTDEDREGDQHAWIVCRLSQVIWMPDSINSQEVEALRATLESLEPVLPYDADRTKLYLRILQEGKEQGTGLKVSDV